MRTPFTWSCSGEPGNAMTLVSGMYSRPRSTKRARASRSIGGISRPFGRPDKCGVNSRTDNLIQPRQEDPRCFFIAGQCL